MTPNPRETRGSSGRLRAAWVAACAALAGFLPASPAPRADVVQARPLASFPTETIAIETRSARRHVFRAWRADEPVTRAQGLMFVRELPPRAAMVFVYDPPEPVSMWMKNTYVPLDMLFVDARGCIARIVERTRPLSLETIESGGPVAVVVELAAGTVAALALKPGDLLLRPDAAWPVRGADARPCTPANAIR